MTSAITRLADPYDRQARLYPALLAVAPAVLTVTSLYGAHTSLFTSGVAILVSCGMMFWLANLARDRGKVLEPGLFNAWGGKPSVQLLRHRDARVDSVTKQRYHTALGTRMRIAFPSVESETDDPSRADAVYESATKWLLEQTRDTRRHSLLFKENISYGFRRNMLGLRPYGVGIAIASLGWVLVSAALSEPAGLLGLPATHVVAVTASLTCSLMWLAGATKERVRIVAYAYAERLLGACETLDELPPKARKSAKAMA